MKKLFKRVAPLLLALVMVLGSCLTVSAADNYDSSDISAYSAIIDYCKDHDIDVYSYQTFWTSSNGSTKYLFLSDHMIYSYSGNFFFYEEGNYKLFSYSNGSVSSVTSGARAAGMAIQFKGFYNRHLLSNYNIYVSSRGVYSESNTIFSNADTTGFFPAPPPLVAAVKGAAPEEALKEVILLIPLSILFLAGCLGLRKGLRLLLTLLRRA